MLVHARKGGVSAGADGIGWRIRRGRRNMEVLSAAEEAPASAGGAAGYRGRQSRHRRVQAGPCAASGGRAGSGGGQRDC